MKMVTIKMIANSDDEKAIEKWLERITTDGAMTIDYEIDFAPLSPELTKSLENEDYSPGDAFGAWLIFSPKQSDGDPLMGFYSEDDGWGKHGLATLYPYNADAQAISGCTEAILVCDYGEAYFSRKL
jgi:hypothetical protein